MYGLLLSVFSLACLSCNSVWCSPNETELVNQLLGDYQQFARPVADASLPLTLEIKVTLKQIVDLDERNQILKTNVWLEYYWNDTNLMWKPVNLSLML